MDTNYSARPTFGGKRKTPEFYARLNAVIAPMRATATLRAIAEELNAQGLRTPTDAPWNKQRLSMYCRNTSL